MPTNDFVPFANSLTNVMALASYDPLAPAGNVTGIASSSYVNRALRQGTTMAAALAQLLMNSSGVNVVDNQNTSDTAINAALYAQLVMALGSIQPVTYTQLSSSGTTAPPVLFYCATPSAAPNFLSSYKDANNMVYTVIGTFTLYGMTIVAMQPASAFATPPLSGVITNVSGPGDASITFYCRRIPLFGILTLMGGGGGGGGTATAASSASSGGGGGGGASLQAMLASLTGTALAFSGYAWAVGAAGTAGATGNNAGGAGGNSTFSTFTANGGGTGFGSAAATTFPHFGAGGQDGGAAASPIGLLWSKKGGYGFLGYGASVTTLMACVGGESFMGGRLLSPFNVGAGANHSDGLAASANSGGGGNGGWQIGNGGTSAGGVGGAGYLQIQWFWQ